MAEKEPDATWALNLLKSNYQAERSFLGPNFGSISLGTVGFVSAVCTNIWIRKPVIAGLQKHLGMTLLGIVVGGFFDRRKANFYAERDAVYRHYITLHPEDFPEPERQKFKDVFSDWVPIR